MGAIVFQAEEVDWIEAPAHFSAFSKLLVNESQGYCEAHVHETAENIYYILKGKGIVELDDKRQLVSPGTVIFIPPGVKHSIINTGFEDLIFIVAASPPQDMPK